MPDDLESSIWAHLGCRITASDGSSFGHLKRPHLPCFVPFRWRAPDASRRGSPPPHTHGRHSLPLLAAPPSLRTGGGSKPGRAGRPPAAGGRAERRRTAPSPPPRKTQEEEGAGRENRDRVPKEASSVATVARSLLKNTHKYVGPCYTMAPRLAVRPTRSAPAPLLGSRYPVVRQRERATSSDKQEVKEPGNEPLRLSE